MALGNHDAIAPLNEVPAAFQAIYFTHYSCQLHELGIDLPLRGK